MDTTTNRFFKFFLRIGRALTPIKFLAVALGHLFIKKNQIRPIVLTLKLDEVRVMGSSMEFFTYFYDHEDDIQFQQIW